jgi:hypothetical protein
LVMASAEGAAVGATVAVAAGVGLDVCVGAVVAVDPEQAAIAMASAGRNRVSARFMGLDSW